MKSNRALTAKGSNRIQASEDRSRISRRTQLEKHRVKGNLHNRGSGEQRGDQNHRSDKRDPRQRGEIRTLKCTKLRQGNE